MSSLPEQKLYIHGRYVNATSGETFESINPATNEVICRIQVASEADVEKAVTSAQEGFEKWSAMSGAERGRILLKAVALLRERNLELAALEVLDTGKPIQEADCVDILSGADAIEYFAGVAASLHGQHYDLGTSFAYTRREPLGICAGIGAWNYPIQIACWKSGPALACGNAMIFKPAALTPLTTYKLAEIYTEAGVPDGVFNVVQGHAATGQMLSRHPKIAKISLTGSVATGKLVMADAAKTLKSVTMELGGKSPLIIFADANLDQAVSAAIMANFYTQGEVCSNGTRVFVAESIEDAFTERLLARVRKMKIGDPTDPETHVGALISKEHMHKVLGYIESGKKEGAKLLCGGGRPSDPHLAAGNFVEPTIFSECRDEMTIVKEEIFGPVMSLLSFPDEDETGVIRRANDTDFGLAAGVFTQNIQRAHRVVAKLQAGTCWINNYNITPIEMPFGGYKQSGIGRENSLTTIEHYTQLKSVYVEMGEVEAPY
ncbi:MAG: betaine-aldehyde dehydrogenase [SAR324 cluster bacterium]|uniref:Betaine-aldehyde dehydrogenase n=1 Tax=SAR324 cluster bacterium TaxID=2024889 RepID=A0A2A4T8S8_9DELT|nr:MAG: betaine-aldehyde dehydrogenase [SAR324 cluster bacterium]